MTRILIIVRNFHRFGWVGSVISVCSVGFGYTFTYKPSKVNLLNTSGKLLIGLRE